MKYIFKCENCSNRMVMEVTNSKNVKGTLQITCNYCFKVKEVKVDYG